MAYIIHSKQFDQLKEIERVAETTYKRRTIKINLMDRIKEAVQKVRWERLRKVEKVIDEILYRLSDRGFSFTGREKLADACKCSLSTVDKAIRLLKESDLFVVAYRHNPKGNGYKTPVIICTIHKNYTTIKKILGFDFTGEVLQQKMKRFEEVKNKEENKVESVRKSYLDWLQEAKKVSTNLFTIKHDINKHIYDTDLIQKVSKLSTDNIVRYIALKVEDYRQNGGKIDHLSSFIEKTFAHTVKMSGAVKGIQNPLKRSEPACDRSLLFYNWLEQ